MKMFEKVCLVAMLGISVVLSQRPNCESLPKEENSELAARSNHVFMGLSSEEVQEVVRYLLSAPDLNLIPAFNATLKSNYIYSIENFIPKKRHVLKFLNGETEDCMRMARAIVFKGESQKVLDLIVGPIPNPAFHTETHVNHKNKEIPWNSRPSGGADAEIVVPFIMEIIASLSTLLNKMVSNYCEDFNECATPQFFPRMSMDSNERHFPVWFAMSPGAFQAYYVLPLPFQMVLAYENGGERVIIREILYNAVSYATVDELLADVGKDESKHIVMPEWNDTLAEFGSPSFLNPDESTDDVRRPPAQFYPDGQRFRIDGHHVEWLKWSFNLHTLTVSGLQLFDLRFNGERIAYEISIQDISVIYAGLEPDGYFKSLIDNGFGVGRLSSPLIRGVDCPEGSEYLNATVYATEFDDTQLIPDAICIFEHRNSVPLRRHYSTDIGGSYRFAFSMPDTVLIVRQILTVTNYDYIYDIEIHQNGVVEAKVSSTGYIQMANNIDPQEIKHGILLQPAWNDIGLFHQHLFNFKLDVDVKGGECNSFKTTNFAAGRTKSRYANGSPWYAPVMNETAVEYEEDAKVRFDFDKPKQYIIHQGCGGKDSETRYGYRLHSNGFTKLLIPDDCPMIKGALSWAKYQVAVTKHDDSERSTSSYFTQGNLAQPDVNFDEYTTDNDRIVDTDLVAWITVGLNHLPTNEDMPVTTTSGKTLSASIYPYNFFQRDPSIHSRDGTVFYYGPDGAEGDFLHWNETCKAIVNQPELNAPEPPPFYFNSTEGEEFPPDFTTTTVFTTTTTPAP